MFAIVSEYYEGFLSQPIQDDSIVERDPLGGLEQAIKLGVGSSLFLGVALLGFMKSNGLIWLIKYYPRPFITHSPSPYPPTLVSPSVGLGGPLSEPLEPRIHLHKQQNRDQHELPFFSSSAVISNVWGGR
jgi:hypothetical protein